MPALKNLKREAFCRKILEGTKHGISQAEAYERSGYRTSGHASEVAASRLLSTVEVQRRIAELAAPAFKKTQITVETLLGELEANIAGATAAQQHGAVNGSIALMGKLRGLLTEKIEVEVGVGREFKIEEMVDQFGDGNPSTALARFDEVMGEIRGELLDLAATHAKVIDPSPPASRPSHEALLAIEMLRPTPRGRGR